MSDEIKRATGLLVIEVINSNPNGDPDRESDPRQRPDGKGEISPVSYKRKLRDLVEDKEGPVWKSLCAELDLDPAQFAILESRGRKRDEIKREMANGEFKRKYWDGRIFGNTFLEGEMDKGTIKTGVVQFGLG
ncbi:MAG: type I CRISPR-associated protein Cas7, partial [Pyrinomonadaceae bacterium]